MKRLQRSIKGEVSCEGVGVFTGSFVRVRFLPAPADSGIRFIRTDLPGRPELPANVDTIHARFRRTSLVKGDVEVETVEHLLSALSGLGIDNIRVEMDGGEVPGMDGSSMPFVELLRGAGIFEYEQPKVITVIQEPISVNDKGNTIVALPFDAGFTISFTLSYEDPIVGSQYFSLGITEIGYINEIAPARTFLLQSEAQAILSQGLGKGANYGNTLVVGPDGVIENSLRFKDEFVRHKILDLIGDLAVLNTDLRAHIVAVRTGHSANIKLVRKIARMKEQVEQTKTETLMDVREIHKILPHRYPMLLIDRVIELDGYKRAVGIKNVTFNEPFFQGHFPDQPIMPGVLQIEAMAQLAGALLMRKSEVANRLAVLLSMDGVRLRRTVIPGDQLRIEAETVRIKSRTAEVYTRATVDGQIVAEATMKFMLMEKG
jgi:UDP-3-O-[3-hydroxymyristoyl] N-acetylglucosamine deacetylase/3-hydroxyacyl-[acyl-carrier-protein] dehydratase